MEGKSGGREGEAEEGRGYREGMEGKGEKEEGRLRVKITPQLPP